MKRKMHSMVSFLAVITALSLGLATPVWAETSANIQGTGGEINSGNNNQIANSTGVVVVQNDSNNVDGSSNTKSSISGTGASIQNGNYNTAIGIGVQIGSSSTGISGTNNTGYGAFAGYGDSNVAVGSNAHAGGGVTQSGQTVISNNNTAIGTGAWATGGTSVAIGTNAQAYYGNSVAIGANSYADRPNSVSVGSYGNERQITNLAPGVYDTDAVNMSQLRGVDHKVNRVGAVAVAFSALAPMGYDPKEPTQFTAGMGTYNGTGAIAIGMYRYTNRDVMINGAIAISTDGTGWEKAARFGVTWRTGGPRQQELSPAIPAAQPKEGIVDRVNRILVEGDKAE